MLTEQSGKKISIGLTIPLIFLTITIAGLIWRGAQTASMAQDAHKFVVDNQSLPSRVCVLEEQSRKFNLNSEKLIEAVTIQKAIRAEQESMKNNIAEILRVVNRHRMETEKGN